MCHLFLDINGYGLDADPVWLHTRILHCLDQKEGRFETMVRALRSGITER